MLKIDRQVRPAARRRSSLVVDYVEKVALRHVGGGLFEVVLIETDGSRSPLMKALGRVTTERVLISEAKTRISDRKGQKTR